MPHRYFSEEDKLLIKKAIETAENQTSGEIRVHIDRECKDDALDRAAFIFEKLKMHKTDLRNGVLIYLAIQSRQFAIIGDAGINQKVPGNFWDLVKDKMLQHFKEENFVLGLSEGIKMAGEQLALFFPYKKNDSNELSDEISFGSI